MKVAPGYQDRVEQRLFTLACDLAKDGKIQEALDIAERRFSDDPNIFRLIDFIEAQIERGIDVYMDIDWEIDARFCWE